MNRETKAMILEAMTATAAEHGLTQAELRERISQRIDCGLHDPDPVLRSLWKRIPADGECPTPEEAVGFLTAVRLGFIKK